MTPPVTPPEPRADRARETPRPPPDPGRLRAEANHLHRALFGHDAPAEVQRQYADALQGAPLAEFPRCDLTRLMERGIDLEAIELALRRRARVNALTQRFHVLCYLVEVRPEYYPRFVNESSRFAVGWLTLGLHAARSVYKLVKGLCLLRIHGVG